MGYSLSKMAKLTGTVKWFNAVKGFGFITPDTGDDVFVHHTSIHAPEGAYRSLADGESVEFSLHTADDGKVSAADVTGPEGAFVKGRPVRRRGGRRRKKEDEEGEGE